MILIKQRLQNPKSSSIEGIHTGACCICWAVATLILCPVAPSPLPQVLLQNFARLVNQTLQNPKFSTRHSRGFSHWILLYSCHTHGGGHVLQQPWAAAAVLCQGHGPAPPGGLPGRHHPDTPPRGGHSHLLLAWMLSVKMGDERAASTSAASSLAWEHAS